jgi:hypothetical protein
MIAFHSADHAAAKVLDVGHVSHQLAVDILKQQIGAWELGSDSGACSDSEAAVGTSQLSGDNQHLSIESACIAVDALATPNLYLGTLYTTTANVYARLYLHFYSDGACDGFSDLGFSGGSLFAGTSPSWSHLLGALPILAEAGSLRIVLDFNPAIAGSPQFTGAFDRIYLGVEPRLLIDGFEVDGGSTCRWTSTADL